MSKKKDKTTIEIIGGNCEGVTGSCSKIQHMGETYLFECGLIQDGKTILESYRLNKKMLQNIKPKEISVIIVGHFHCDHVSNVPSLYSDGKCNARIIVPKHSTSILKEMWLDCAFINARDAEYLSLKSGKIVEPLYTESDVYTALNYVEEYTSHEIHDITPNLSIRYTPAGHILLSQQTELFFKTNSRVTKALFTSDLGNIVTQDERVFVENFEPISKVQIVIGECTYSAPGRDVSKKDYETDVKKIKSVIEQYCVDMNSRVLMPTFSLDRLPYMLWILYSLFGKDEKFTIPILVDSPLAIRLLKCYSSILDGDKKEKFDDMMAWKNIRLIVEPEESKSAIVSKGPKVILSSSGMLVAGRSVKWLQSVLPRENDCILFSGYAGIDTLAHRVKNSKENKTISINGKPYKNKAQIVDLKSFSSHMQRKDLINYYKGIVADKIYLVHSDDNKIQFKEDLEKAIADSLRTTRVIATNKSTKISL